MLLEKRYIAMYCNIADLKIVKIMRDRNQSVFIF